MPTPTQPQYILMPKTPPQPFWTSKTFWVLSIGLVFNIAKLTGKLPADLNTMEVGNMVLGILAIIFRWQADQPLTTDPGATMLPPPGSGDH